MVARGANNQLTRKKIMANNNNHKNTSKVREVAGVGMGLAAVAAAAAGAYFLYGKEGAKNRKKVKSWMLKMKAEVLEGLENAKEVNEKTYRKVVADVTRRYKNIDKKELADMARELMGHWRNISKQVVAAVPKKPRAKRKTSKK